jgi:hypothetical protein
LRQRGELTVAVNEAHRTIDRQQSFERFSHHRSRQHVAAHHNQIEIDIGEFSENGVECREISVNVIEGRDASCRAHLWSRLASSASGLVWRAFEFLLCRDLLMSLTFAFDRCSFR